MSTYISFLSQHKTDCLNLSLPGHIGLSWENFVLKLVSTIFPYFRAQKHIIASSLKANFTCAFFTSTIIFDSTQRVARLTPLLVLEWVKVSKPYCYLYSNQWMSFILSAMWVNEKIRQYTSEPHCRGNTRLISLLGYIILFFATSMYKPHLSLLFR